MSSPPPEPSFADDLQQPVHDLTAEPADPNARSNQTLADLSTEPGQAALGPTADNDLDLLRRHFEAAIASGPGEGGPRP